MKNSERNASGEQWEDPYKPSKSHRWIKGIGLLLVLYLFSTGPAALLQKKGVISEGTWQTIYTPVNALSARVPPLQSALTWYMELWGVE